MKDDGSAHMVVVSEKQATHRVAIARGRIEFSNHQARRLIPASLMKKGDVLATARIAGIMAAKRTADLIPLCHPLNLTAVEVEVLLNQEMHRQSASGQDVPEDFGGVDVTARVECRGPTGVEMEALTAVTAACLTVVDMCKGVDRGIRIEGVRVILKRGGRSGEWKEEGFDETRWLGH